MLDRIVAETGERFCDPGPRSRNAGVDQKLAIATSQHGNISA